MSRCYWLPRTFLLHVAKLFGRSDFHGRWMPTSWFKNRLLVVFMLSTLGVTGCGKGGLATYPVEGTFKYQGTEDTIPGAKLELRAQARDDKHGQATVTGVVGEDGTITLTTFEKGDGVPSGSYQIILKEPPIPLGWSVDEHGDLPPSKIPEKYKSYSTSDLTVEISPDGENRLDIQIERPRR